MKNLEIVIITYNRAPFLQRTLEQLCSSPFAYFKITVLNNVSTDNTLEICQRFTGCLQDFRVVTHRVNIGGNANYLRAVELSESVYTWVLCDDDMLDFSSADDLLSALESEKFDLLEVGSTARQPWEAGLTTTTQESLRLGSKYFLGLSFMPAVIFRTSLFDSTCLCQGYDLIKTWYPHFALLNKGLAIDARIYFAKHPLVIRNDINESTFSPLSWYANWVSSCSYIADPGFRNDAIRQATELRGYFRSLAFWIAIEKHHDPKQFWDKMAAIFVGYPNRQRPLLLLFLPLMLVPLPLSMLVWARDLIYRLMRVPKEKIPSLVINTRD